MLGYGLLTLGLTAIIIQVIGLHWYFLGWLEMGGRLLAFIIKILMTIAGFLIIFFARTDWDREVKESSE